MNAKLPNFLIIGAAKSGTSALFEYLEQHPEAFMCHPKEPQFLAFEGQKLAFTAPGDAETINRLAITDYARYEALFAKAGNARAIGDASVSTLYYGESIERIKKYMPQAKLICMLRQPADRAYSAFSYMQMRTFEPCDSFTDALAQEERRLAQGWHHIWHYHRMGMYHDQVKRYLNAFPREQLKFYLFDDFRRDPAAVLRDCFEFLEIDPNFVPPEEPAPLVSGKPKRAWLQALAMRSSALKSMFKAVLPKSMRKWMQKQVKETNLERVTIDPQVRAELTLSFRDDILRLQDLLDRDLSGWFAEKSAKQRSEPAHAAT